MIFFEAFLLAFPFTLLCLLVFFFTSSDAKYMAWQKKVKGCLILAAGGSAIFGVIVWLAEHYVPFIRGFFA